MELKIVDEIIQIKCTEKPMPLNSGCILSLLPKSRTEGEFLDFEFKASFLCVTGGNNHHASLTEGLNK